MNYSRKKVNFIIFTLITLIAMVTIFAAVDLTEEQDISNPSVVAEDEASSEGGDESQKAEETKVELIKAPTFSSGWAALNYALEIAENNDFVMTGAGVGKNDPQLGFVVTQFVNEKLYKTGNNRILVSKMNCDNSQGANYTKYTYNNGKNVTYKYDNLDGSTMIAKTTMSVDEFINKNGRPTPISNYELNSKTCNMDSFKISGASYVIKLTVNASVPGIFENMEKVIKNSPQKLSAVICKSATLEIKINRKTGAFESIKTTERYYLEVNFAIKSMITTVANQTFSWKSVDISNLIKQIVD